MIKLGEGHRPNSVSLTSILANLSFSVAMLSMFAIACNSLMPPHPKSYKLERETVDVALLNTPKTQLPPATADEARAMAAGVAVIAGIAIDVAVSAVKSELDKEARRYIAGYSGVGVGDKFYADYDPKSLTRWLNVIEISRTVQLEDSKESSGTRAYFLRLAVKPVFPDMAESTPEPADQLTFTLEPIAIRVDYAKAKIARREWYFPWTWCITPDENIDVLLDLTISSTWLDADGQPQRWTESGQLAFKDVGLGTTYETPTCRGSLCAMHFRPPPRTRNPINGLYDKAIYRVNVNVVETDDYEKRAKKIAEIGSKGADAIGAAVKKAIDGAIE